MFNMVDMDMFYIVLFISWVMCFVCGAALGNYKYCGSYMGFFMFSFGLDRSCYFALFAFKKRKFGE